MCGMVASCIQVSSILPVTLEDPQAWCSTGPVLDFNARTTNYFSFVCSCVEEMFARHFANITANEVAAPKPAGRVLKALQIATEVAEFGTQCQSKSWACGIAPHGTRACKLWTTMLGFRTCHVSDLEEVVEWYRTHETNPDAIPTVSKSAVAQMLASSPHAGTRQGVPQREPTL